MTKVTPTLAEDIIAAISCMQDYRDTIDMNSELWYKISERIERLFKFYYQLTGFDPIGDK
jgi:hypothetical protein